MRPISRHDKKVLLQVEGSQHAMLHADCDVILVQASTGATVAVHSSSSNTIRILTDGTVSLVSPDESPNVLLSCTNRSLVIIASKNLEDVLHAEDVLYTEDGELSPRLKELQITAWPNPEDPAETTQTS